MKNILVCIKQVPDTTEIRIDPVKKTLIREGVPSIVNPFDAYALELAARIKDKEPGTKITLVSMGPPQAENALRECLAVGGDKAYLVSGREFGGSDTLATSYILSCAIKKLEELEGKSVSYPCLITVTKPSFDPRFPTIKSKMAAKKAEINVLAYADLEAGMDNERIGLKGSPTKVKKTFTPEVKTSGVKINEPTSEEGAEKLFAILCEDKVF